MTIISLVNVEERNYLFEIGRALAANGYPEKATEFRTHPPRDLAEAFTRLPDDVCIRLWEVPDATHNQS
jgi:hypothetical protein